ncbi:hypothetical protein ABKV19_023486 [Rosa sericea]
MQMHETVEGKGDHEAALAIWDCGSPLYDSYELASVSHLIERHLMAFPSLGGSSKRFIAKFSHSSSSKTTSTTSNSTTMKEAKGSNSMEENLSKILGIKKMWKRKGLFGGTKEKTKKMKTTGFSGFYSRFGLWRKKECR